MYTGNGETPSVTEVLPVTSTKQTNNKEEEEDENAYPRKRKFKTKPETITSQPTTTDIDIDPNPVPVPTTATPYEKVPNSFDMFYSLRRKVSFVIVCKLTLSLIRQFCSRRL